MCDCAIAENNGETTDDDARPPSRELSFEDLSGWFLCIGASIFLLTLIRYIYKNSDKLSGGGGFLSNLGALSLNGVRSLGSVGNLVPLRSLNNFGGFGSWRGSLPTTSSSTGVTSTVDSGGTRRSWSIGSWGRSGSSTTTDSGGRGWSIPRPSWGRSGGGTDSSAVTPNASSAAAGGGGWSIPRPSWGRSGGGTDSSAVTPKASSTAAGGGGWTTGNWGRSSSTEETKTGSIRGTGTTGGGSSTATEVTADSGGRGWNIPKPRWGRSGGAPDSSPVTANASGSGAGGGGGWSTGNWGSSSSTEGTKGGSIRDTGTAGRGSSTTMEVTADSGGRGWNIPRPSWGRSSGATEGSAVKASASGSGAVGGGGWSVGNWSKLSSTEGTKTGGTTGSSTSVATLPGNSNNVGWVWGKPSITEDTPGETGISTKTEAPVGFSKRTDSKPNPDTRSNTNGIWGRISLDVSKDGAGALVETSSTKKSNGSEGKRTIKSDTSKSPGSWSKWGSSVLSGISGEARGDKNIPHITTDSKRKENIEIPEGSDRRSSNGKTGESWSWAGWDTTKSTVKPKEKIDTTHETIKKKREISVKVKSPEVTTNMDSLGNWRNKGRVTVIDRRDKDTPPETSSRIINTTLHDRDRPTFNDSSYAISKAFDRKGDHYGKSSVPRKKDKTDSAKSIGETKYSAGPDVTSSISENADEFRSSYRDSSKSNFDGKDRESEDTTRSRGRFQAVHDKPSKNISRDFERKKGSEKKEGGSDVTDSAGGYGGSHGYGSRNDFESTKGYGKNKKDNTGVSDVYGSNNTYGSKVGAGSSIYSEPDGKENGARQNGSSKRSNNNGYGSDKKSRSYPLPSFEDITNNKHHQTGSYRSTQRNGTFSSGASTGKTDIAKGNTGTAKSNTGTPIRYRSGAIWQREDIEGTSSQIPNVEIKSDDLPSIEEDEEQIMEKRKTDPCYGIYRQRY